MSHVIHIGSNLDVLPTLPDNSIDSIVTDPPYELGFMGKSWDSTGIAYNVGLWKECLRVLKPGGHLLAFSGSRTYHRMTCAIEDAGFEVRDQMMWVYGSGFPKSHNISKAIDKSEGHWRGKAGKLVSNNGAMSGGNYERKPIGNPITEPAKQWDGWGTALKPAHEPICLARKTLEGTVAENVVKWGVGGINIDACRVGEIKGRFPANLMHDGSQDVVELFPGEEGASAARFFYCPKASKSDRDDGWDIFPNKELDCYSDFKGTPEHAPKNNIFRRNVHPTVKPTDLMRYLCRLITPPAGTVLDPFTGSGSTGRGAILEGFNFVGIELSAEYALIANARIESTKYTKNNE